MNSKLLRSVSCATLIAFTLASVAPLAQAGVIPTEQALAVDGVAVARARLADALVRDDVQQQLVARGVDPALVAARVALLTDDEVLRLDSRIDQMPAGGDIVGTVLFIFLVLLITDLLGWTHVFPFTNKGSVGN